MVGSTGSEAEPVRGNVGMTRIRAHIYLYTINNSGEQIANITNFSAKNMNH